MKTRAIGAHELHEGHTLIGDSICPTRYGAGVRVEVANDGLAGTVLVVAGGQDLEFNADETVYVVRAA